ncbi:putative RNA binding protein [Leishmania mexicana MHOM/GT/2001/U1103]|uniref:RNA binding protein n=1 Tax=Leishmania mexicana (strain MHOM/GT/2001/U1103) TaxID=929439 RepID=E9AS78_LEIMU|nr:putative RNA binding protein [Leishmania mexicana MHOM/GT/2001/U1103]CBZ25799.1 putative RNA binding protein [Leishmania mexicana MHOM/GT/2001/U1103]
MADYNAAGADAAVVVDDNVPPGITAKQDEIIQYVAKYVVASCDGARYQDKVRTRTKHNPYFDFLNAKHPYHQYYQYLLESYRHWMRNSEAVGTGTWGGGVDAMQSQGPQQQWNEEDYYQYYGAYAGQASGIEFQGNAAGHLGEGSSYVDAPSSAHAQNASSGVDPTSYGSEAVPATGYGASYDPSAVGPEPAQAGTTAGGGEAQAEEDEDDEYELVMENGQWVSRKRM